MSYVIFGRAIKNEYLTLGTLFGVTAIALASSGGKKEEKKPTTLEQVKEAVKFNAGSSEEENLANSIKKFIEDAEKETKH